MAEEVRGLRSVTFSIEALQDLLRTAVEAGAMDANTDRDVRPDAMSRPVDKVAEEVWQEWLARQNDVSVLEAD